MDIPTVVAGFAGASPIEGLDGGWRWSPVPGLEFAGVLSADENRLLQIGARDTFDRELAIAALRFARTHEAQITARNPFLGALTGFNAPAGHGFDAVAIAAPEVHGFYEFENPALNPAVRVVFPAYAIEFSGTEDFDDAITRYDMIPTANLTRGPVPYLKMRYINTRTRGQSTNPGRAFTEPENLYRELREMDGGEDSLVEFEDRHGKVWRVEWHDGWWMADWTNQDGAPREISLDDLLTFAEERLHH